VDAPHLVELGSRDACGNEVDVGAGAHVEDELLPIANLYEEAGGHLLEGKHKRISARLRMTSTVCISAGKTQRLEHKRRLYKGRYLATEPCGHGS
jgi:hypothetical protein